MRVRPFLTFAIFGKMCSAVCSRAFFSTCSQCFRAATDRASSTKTSASMYEYHTSSARMVPYSRMCSRYDCAIVTTASSQRFRFKPNSRDARTMLAASRLTSHSQGAGKVSSKSLMSNSSRRSGLAKPPKFHAWQSPHACTRIPVAGVFERSQAIKAAEPRKKASGDCRMRPLRIGKSSGRRPRSEYRSTSIGQVGPREQCTRHGNVGRSFPAELSPGSCALHCLVQPPSTLRVECYESFRRAHRIDVSHSRVSLSLSRKQFFRRPNDYFPAAFFHYSLAIPVAHEARHCEKAHIRK